MKYPTVDEINVASREQLGRWIRFLPSPGMSAFGTDQVTEVASLESELLASMIERFNSLGGWNAALSKSIGWGSKKYGLSRNN